MQPIRQLTTDEVQRALQAAGSNTSSAPGSAPTPAPPSASARVNYAPVFHPGATDIRAAATIPLGDRRGTDRRRHHDAARADGDDLGDGHLAVRRAAAVAVGPARARRSADRDARRRRACVASRPRQAGGAYAFTGVAPGTYTVKARSGMGTRARRRQVHGSGPPRK